MTVLKDQVPKREGTKSRHTKRWRRLEGDEKLMGNFVGNFMGLALTFSLHPTARLGVFMGSFLGKTRNSTMHRAQQTHPGFSWCCWE